MRKSRHVLTALALLACAAAPAGFTQDAEDAELRELRWKDIQHAVFGERELLDGTGLLQLDAPARALDAAAVPVGVTISPEIAVKGVYLIIDNNPSPLAAHFRFGPKADPRALQFRVRVDQYTPMRAVAETQDGKLYAVERFVKASGGCSAPAGPDNEAALREMGRMKLRLQGEFAAGEPLQAQLMIRHPNFNGMQMDQITRYYTPAHYIRTIDVSYAGEPVLQLESDISLSTDPVITFGFIPEREGQLKVIARDSKDMVFDRLFPVPASATPSNDS